MSFSSALFASNGQVGAFFVPEPDSDSELALDLTLALSGSLVSASGEKAVPYNVMARKLKFISAALPGDCVQSAECLANTREEMGLTVLVIGTWSETENGRLQVKLARVHRDPLHRFSRSREFPNTPLDLARNLDEMAQEMIKPPRSMLVVAGSGELDVEIDGTRIGSEAGTFIISPGRHDIILRQGGTIVLDSQIVCPIGLTCSAEVPGKLPKQTLAQVGTSKTKEIQLKSRTPTNWMQIGGYTSTAIGATLLILAALQGQKVSDVEDQIGDKCNTSQDPVLCTDLTLNQYMALQNDGETYATQANILLVSGSVLTAAGIGMVIFDLLNPSGPKAAQSPHSSMKHLSAFKFDLWGGATWIRHTIEF